MNTLNPITNTFWTISHLRGGILSSNVFNYVFLHFFFFFFFYEKKKPTFSVKGMILLYNRKMSPLSSSTPSRNQRARIGHLGSCSQECQMACGQTDWNQAVNAVPELQKNMFTGALALRSELPLCSLRKLSDVRCPCARCFSENSLYLGLLLWKVGINRPYLKPVQVGGQRYDNFWWEDVQGVTHSHGLTSWPQIES